MPLLRAFIFSFFCGNLLFAHEGDFLKMGGREIEFSYESPSPASPKKAGTIFILGPTDPSPISFDALLFQGFLSDPGLKFEVQALPPSGRPTRWSRAEIYPGPKGRYFARAALKGEAGSRVRIRAFQKDDAERLEVRIKGVQVLMDLSEPDSTAPLGIAPPPRIGEPKKFHDRSKWGARAPRQDYQPHKSYRITLHHTAGSLTVKEADSKAEIYWIQEYHQKGLGWNDIAYHFLIDGAGRIYGGRPMDKMGAHVRGHNEGNVGVALLGDFDVEVPLKAQLESARELLRWITSIRAADPSTLKGHRDYVSTGCPGRFFYPLIPKLKEGLVLPRASIAGFDTPHIRILEALSERNLGALDGKISLLAPPPVFAH